jgi:hypothetical protein
MDNSGERGREEVTARLIGRQPESHQVANGALRRCMYLNFLGKARAGGERIRTSAKVSPPVVNDSLPRQAERPAVCHRAEEPSRSQVGCSSQCRAVHVAMKCDFPGAPIGNWF